MQEQLERYKRITKYLANLYTMPLYHTHDDLAHPVVFFPASASQINDVESILGRFPQTQISTDDVSIYDYGFLHSIQNAKSSLYNGTTFTLHHLRTAPLKIEAHYGTYYDMLATCAAMEKELFDAASSRLMRLPLRSQYHREISPSRAITHGRDRSAAIGVAVLLVFQHEGTYRAVYSRRTAAHATRANAYHLLPAFIFQPQGHPAKKEEWSIRHHVYREFLEELFGVEEYSRENMFDHPALLDLIRMEGEKQAGLYLVGVALNLLTLRPDICLTLLIHDPDWWERIHHDDGLFQIDTTAEAQGSLLTIPITPENTAQARSAEAFLSKETVIEMVPQAIVALWEGIGVARNYINMSK